MYEMIIVGAGAAGISMAAEAQSTGISASQILVLEKGARHSWAIRKRCERFAGAVARLSRRAPVGN